MCWINVNSNDIAKLFKQGDTNIYIFLSMHNVLVLKNCVRFSNIWLTTGVTLYHLLSMSFILSLYKTDDVTFSKTSFFLCDEREFFRLGNVPLRVISGHPLLKSNSTSSLAPAVLAYDTADLPSWSIALTFALD